MPVSDVQVGINWAAKDLAQNDLWRWFHKWDKLELLERITPVDIESRRPNPCFVFSNCSQVNIYKTAVYFVHYKKVCNKMKIESETVYQFQIYSWPNSSCIIEGL